MSKGRNGVPGLAHRRTDLRRGRRGRRRIRDPRDVTEQKQAFEAAQRMAAIVENSDDAIIGRTLDGIITSWNPAAERMYGYSSEEIIGKSVILLSPEDRAGEMIAILAKISAGQPVERLETIRVRKDGTVFPVSLTVSPIRDPDGTIVGASAIARDMTEQKQARRPEPMAAGPAVTISPGQITDVNEARKHRLPSEVIGRLLLLTDPTKPQATTGVARGAPPPLTLRHRGRDLLDVCNASPTATPRQIVGMSRRPRRDRAEGSPERPEPGRGGGPGPYRDGVRLDRYRPGRPGRLLPGRQPLVVRPSRVRRSVVPGTPGS